MIYTPEMSSLEKRASFVSVLAREKRSLQTFRRFFPVTSIYTYQITEMERQAGSIYRVYSKEKEQDYTYRNDDFGQFH